MDFLQIILLIISGAFAGTMAGMLGVGGGIIYVPAISYILSLKQIEPEAIPLIAVSTSLSIILVSITSSLTKHWKNQFVVHSTNQKKQTVFSSSSRIISRFGFYLFRCWWWHHYCSDSILFLQTGDKSSDRYFQWFYFPDCFVKRFFIFIRKCIHPLKESLLILLPGQKLTMESGDVLFQDFLSVFYIQLKQIKYPFLQS